MEMSSTITLTGRLTAPPELRFSPSGTAVAAFTVVTSRRVKDQATGEWSDADTTYWDCKAFKQIAENICESLDKGLEVIVVGRAVQESWEDRQTGQKRSKISVRVDSIGPSLRGATAKVTKSSGGGRGNQGGQGGGGWGGGSGGGNQGQGGSQGDDPWASGAPAGGGQGGWSDEAPF
ncbi:single-stranded DNA-binding protein [Streptomyces eurythermus]